MAHIVETPCRMLCGLDANRVCTSCGRTVDEIVRWGRMTPQERRAIMDRLEREFQPPPRGGRS